MSFPHSTIYKLVRRAPKEVIMALVTLTAEISERNLGYNNNKVIRIFADRKHVYTRTCVIGYSGRIHSHKSNFNPAKERGIKLSSQFCREVKALANTFGKDNERFNQYASRTRYISIEIPRDDATGAVLAGVAVWALASAIIKASK